MDKVPAEELETRAESGDTDAQLQLALRCDIDGQAAKATAWMRRAAEAGDIRGKTLIAMRLVSFKPLDIQEGVKWAREAAAAGSADAIRVLSLLTAEGLGVPQSWPGALQWMGRAAELGHRRAQAELAAMCGDWRLAREIAQGRILPQEQCRHLGRSIDLSDLLKVPDVQIASIAPRIALVGKFLSPEVCDWIIDAARPTLQSAQVVDNQTGAARTAPIRDNSESSMEVGGSDLVLALVRARIAVLTGLPTSGFEMTSTLRYQMGQQFLPHFDFLDKSLPGHAEDFAYRGQRVATFLVYLNEEYEGGETAFPLAKARYRGRKGDALFFWNVTANGVPDRNTWHAGLPPTRGEKWLLSQWIRLRPP
jgi:prolyl 4-hydroxylase